MKILIIQPALPSYRLGFFERLDRTDGVLLKVVFPNKVELNVPGIDQYSDWSLAFGRVFKFSGLIWQSIPLDALWDSDVVVCHGNLRDISSLITLALCKVFGKPIIWWGHANGRDRHRLIEKLRLVVMGLCDGVLVYSDLEKAMLKKRTHRLKYIEALNNSIDSELSASLRTEFAWRNRQNILFVGRLTEKANLKLLLFALATPACAKIKLTVVGDGCQRINLKSLARSLGLSARVNWVGATYDELVLASYMNKARIFVYPGDVGLSLIHAMSYGLPILVHNRRDRHMPEIGVYKNVVHGFVFKQDDAVDLARKIGELWELQDELNEMAENCISAIDGKLGSCQMARKLCALASQVID